MVCSVIEKERVYPFPEKKKYHARVKQVLSRLKDAPPAPSVVLKEVGCLLHARPGHQPMRRVLSKLMDNSILLQPATEFDPSRMFPMPRIPHLKSHG